MCRKKPRGLAQACQNCRRNRQVLDGLLGPLDAHEGGRNLGDDREFRRKRHNGTLSEISVAVIMPLNQPANNSPSLIPSFQFCPSWRRLLAGRTLALRRH
jgi:hypothetical protein